jgi:hypothetical protein
MWQGNFGVKPIYTYEEAVQREASIPPIRGDADATKPLGIRRNKHIRIVKNEDGSIGCIHYRTEIVRFKPDGEIVVRLGGWASNSTTALLSFLLDESFYIFDKQVWCRTLTETKEVKEFPLSSHGETKFRRAGHALQIIQPPIHKIHHIRRKGLNNVRARYADFRNYIDRTMRLRIETEAKIAKFSNEEFSEIFGEVGSSEGRPIKGLPVFPTPLWKRDYYHCEERHYTKFKALITKEGDEDKTLDYYKAMLWLAAGIEGYRSRGWASTEDLLLHLDHVLMYLHRDEVFKEIPVFGEAKKDSYKNFFYQHTDQSS